MSIRLRRQKSFSIATFDFSSTSRLDISIMETRMNNLRRTPTLHAYRVIKGGEREKERVNERQSHQSNASSSEQKNFQQWKQQPRNNYTGALLSITMIKNKQMSRLHESIKVSPHRLRATNERASFDKSTEIIQFSSILRSSSEQARLQRLR